MFAIANPDASLFQQESGRAAQARQRLLRQHGWALSIRRRDATRSRHPEGGDLVVRSRLLSGEDTRAALLAGESGSSGGAAAPWLPAEPLPLSFNFFY